MYKVIAKQCTKCGFIKLLDSFDNKKNNKFGKRSECKSCRKLYAQEYKKRNAENREIVKKSIISKICPHCDIEKPVNEFYNSTVTKDGYSSWCKSCNYKSSRKWVSENKEHVSEMTKKWRDNNQEHVKEQQKKHYEENKDYYMNLARKRYERVKESYKSRRQELNRIWYSKNKEHRDKLSHEWYENNKDKVLSNTHKRNRNYGFNPINIPFDGAHAHHLWLSEASDMVIYIPSFIHKLYYHNHDKPETMFEINCIALDYWIHEELYHILFFEDIINDKLTLDALDTGVITFIDLSNMMYESRKLSTTKVPSEQTLQEV